MPNLHPFLVHFPVALLTTAFAFDLLAVLLARDELSRVGWWAQVAGSIGIAAAVVSGLIAKAEALVPSPAAATFDTHQQLAFVTAGAFTTLLLWRIGTRTKIDPARPRLYLVLFAAALVCLWRGAWFGGELVYKFGVGFTTPVN